MSFYVYNNTENTLAVSASPLSLNGVPAGAVLARPINCSKFCYDSEYAYAVRMERSNFVHLYGSSSSGNILVLARVL